MQFLVINRPYDSHRTKGGSNELRAHAKNVKAFLKDGTLSAAYAFVGGGHAYVLNASDTKDLALKLRANPLFGTSHTEVIPVADAVEWLEHAADHFAKAGK